MTWTFSTFRAPWRSHRNAPWLERFPADFLQVSPTVATGPVRIVGEWVSGASRPRCDGLRRLPVYWVRCTVLFYFLNFALSFFSTSFGRKELTSPPIEAASLMNLELTNEYSSWAITNTVSTSAAKVLLVSAIWYSYS